MKVVLNGVRLAFADIYEQKAFKAGDKPRCGGNFIMNPNDPAQKVEMLKIFNAINQVAQEKWGAQAADVLKQLKAKGDICLQDGAVKSQYDGFPGNWFVSASNEARPAVVAKKRYKKASGELVAVAVDRAGNTYVEGVKTDVGFPVTAPYAGCIVNVSLDVWAQQNQYGKRVNAKLLAVQFERDGDPFSGGEGYADTDFDDTSEVGGGGSASMGFGGPDDFFGGSAAPVKQPAAGGDPFASSMVSSDPFAATPPVPADPFGF